MPRLALLPVVLLVLLPATAHGALVFDRELRKDKVSGWRWFLGAWGVGTYRQNDSVDIRYTLNGRPMVAEGLDIEADA